MQGSKSVEVRPVGVSKVSTIHILQAMGGVIQVLNSEGFQFVSGLCAGSSHGAYPGRDSASETHPAAHRLRVVLRTLFVQGEALPTPAPQKLSRQ